MILKQFHDQVSHTNTYIVASEVGSDAICIDPVKERTGEYMEFLKANNLRLKAAVDTHIHADHVTGVEELRKSTNCMTMMSKKSGADLVSRELVGGDTIEFGNLTATVIETPGHTSDSICYEIAGMLFTGDTLLIGGNGRTDFQNGSADELFNSIKEKLFSYPDSTLIWPGHDYKNQHCSTVGLEKKQNLRISGKTKDQFKEIMDNLNLPNPKMMDIAVSQNLAVGSKINVHFEDHQVLLPEEAMANIGDALFVDLRSSNEIEKTGMIENAIHVDFCSLQSCIQDTDHQLTKRLNLDKNIIFYCAHGERSAIAIKILEESDFDTGLAHLFGGVSKWLESGFGLVKS